MAKKNRQRRQLIVTAGVVVVLAVGLGIVVLMQRGDGPPPAPPAKPSETDAADKPAPVAEAASDAPKDAAPPGTTFIDEDGRTLWAAPTAGQPIPLAGLPSGCRLILSLRPAAMSQTTDGRIILEQYGESLARLTAELSQATGAELTTFERLTIGVRPGEAVGSLDVTVVAELSQPLPSEPDGAPSLLSPRVARLSPTRYVAASAATLSEIVDAGGEPPPLRRELEQLAADSDDQRHATLLVAPSFLFADGKQIFAGEAAALEEPLFLQLPDDVRGVLVSAHWLSDNFYWEVRAASAAETTATQLAGQLHQRMLRWPGELQLAVLDLDPAPHGRRVVANLPGMTQLLTQYARRGVEGRHAVLNGYLPPAAGHNLLLASELMAAQQSAGHNKLSHNLPQGALGPGGQILPLPKTPKTAADKLQQTATVSFARDTLEMAVRYLADEIDAPIVILGGDLQLEGITKNQSFALDVQNQPGERVLLEILTKANPDKTATGPADPRQKLVYVIKPDDTGQETIYVTTRAAAAKRGERLPEVFEE